MPLTRFPPAREGTPPVPDDALRSAGVPQVVLPQWANCYDYAELVQHLCIGRHGSRSTQPHWNAPELERALLAVVHGEAASAVQLRAEKLRYLCRRRGEAHHAGDAGPRPGAGRGQEDALRSWFGFVCGRPAATEGAQAHQGSLEGDGFLPPRSAFYKASARDLSRNQSSL